MRVGGALHDIIQAINGGEVVIYPTETLYALGCDATCDTACHTIMNIKRRSGHKPLPMIVGSLAMLDMVTAERPPILRELAATFWPGPLSVLLKARPELPCVLSDDEGFTSVRWSGHPFAAELSRRIHKPIVATSANYEDKPAVALPDHLDPELLGEVGAFYSDPPWPGGGEPSTIIRIKDGGRLEIVREGAVTVKMLRDKDFFISV